MITKEKLLRSLNLFSKIMINHRWVNGKLISWSFDHELYEFNLLNPNIKIQILVC